MTMERNKRIIVVLGMHRSGTSAVTRGLMALGVDLGPNLMPAIPNNNETGFWEDLDINALNIELLTHLGHDWHSLSPVQHSEILRKDLAPFMLRAVELLRSKIDKMLLFGVKDPRLARLLPFWSVVFKQLETEVGYVVVVRHPLSVARSLAKRDGFESEKSHYLWLDHSIHSILGTEGAPRVVVNYDRFMDQPLEQLRRIARVLSLPFDPLIHSVDEFLKKFLKEELRHTRFELSDLKLDPSIPPDVTEVYKIFDDLTSDRPVDPKRVRASFRKFAQRLQKLRPAFDYMTRQDRRIAAFDQRVKEQSHLIRAYDEKISGLSRTVADQDQALAGRDAQIGKLGQALHGCDAKIADLDRIVKERDMKIAGLDHAMKERDAKIIGLDHAVRERETKIASLNQTVAKRDHEIAGHNAQIVDLRQEKARKEARIAELDRAVKDGEKRIADIDQNAAIMKQVLAERDARINRLNQTVARQTSAVDRLRLQLNEVQSHLDRVFASPAWRITAPLRFLRAKIIEPFWMSICARWPLFFGGRRTQGKISRENASLTPLSAPKGQLPESVHGPVPRVGADTAPKAAPVVAAQPIAKKYVPLSQDFTDATRSRVKTIAFYLPQFHPIAENNRAWGRGFTEWTNVTKARPQFAGHYQPRLPGELGFYDLRLKEVQKRQIELAKQYGIYGFCYHYYWFEGKKVLERPLEQMLADPSLDLPFCLCWANENWTRRWDGRDHEVILAQHHSAEDDMEFIKSIETALRDPRYIRIDGRPVLMVYRPLLFPDPRATADRWREYARKAGIGDLLIVGAHAYGLQDHLSVGFDGLVQFPPHHRIKTLPAQAIGLINKEYAGKVFDYESFAEESVGFLSPGKATLFPCVMMEWDNEARRPGAGHCFFNASPAKYKQWLEKTFKFVDDNHRPESKMVFVNAWNEWAEGTYLEPDQAYGYAYLQATAEVVRRYYTAADARLNPDGFSKIISSAQQATAAKSSPTALSQRVPKADPRAPHPRTSPVKVSVIIPVYDQIDHVKNCLSSLAANLDADVSVEVIVVNDCSSDETRAALEKVEGIVLVHHEKNAGFLHSCNGALNVAKGEYVWFLNSDAQIRKGALKNLVDALDGNPDYGAVGSKLIYPDGSLQEAGGIVWKDGSAMNFGNKMDPRSPEYNYLREVDYCSAASLMVRKSILEGRGGFDTRYAPAYYEDTDLCFHIRHELGMRVVYHPLSEVIHVEGATCGKDIASPAKSFQIRNQELFFEKWKKELMFHFERGAQPYQASRRLLPVKTILIIERLPLFDQDSGSRRLYELIKIFLELGYRLIFLPEHNRIVDLPYISLLQSRGVEVLCHKPEFPFERDELMRDRMSCVEYVWIGKYELNEKYLSLIKKTKPSVKHIFDTVDLHHLRLKRGSELGLSGEDIGLTTHDLHEVKEMELRMARAADVTLTVTEDERNLLSGEGIDSVWVVPNVHRPVAQLPAGMHNREDIVFIGCYLHKPNVDAAEWLCGKIMPLIWKRNPGIKVYLLGSNPSQRIKSLENERIVVPGYIPDVGEYFERCRVFVCPLRYGAGMKGKVGQALEHSLPIVSTSIGVEGMELTDGKDALIADDEESFALAVLRLYEDSSLWEVLSANSRAVIGKYSPAAVKEKVKEIFAVLDNDAVKGNHKTVSKRKIIIHYHIFKNAGESVGHLLRESFEGRWVSYDEPLDTPSSVIRHGELESFVLANPELRAVSSHKARRPVAPSASLEIYPVVFLRHPLDRLVSLYHFERTEYRKNSYKELIGTKANTLNLKDFLQWCLDAKIWHARNFQTLCLSSAQSVTDKPWEVELGRREFDEAKGFIASLPAFGMVDRFEESLKVIGDWLKPAFPELDLYSVRKNSSQDPSLTLRDKLDRLRQELGEELWERLRNENALDLELYDFALSEFERRIDVSQCISLSQSEAV